MKRTAVTRRSPLPSPRPPSASLPRTPLPSPRRSSPRPALAATLAAGLATLTLGGLTLGPTSHAQSGPVQDLSTFPHTTLEIHGKSGTHRFNVWVADTESRKTQGLMFVRDLPPDEGMLFVDCCSGIWMKNTYIPLDILFVGPNDRIAKIAERARPFDETTIPAPQPVKAVVELKGGEADELGLKVGDRVQWQSPEPGSGAASAAPPPLPQSPPIASPGAGPGAGTN